MQFSQRQGLTPIRAKIQDNWMDEPLKNSLWSLIYLFFFDQENGVFVEEETGEFKARRIWTGFLNHTWDSFPKGENYALGESNFLIYIICYCLTTLPWYGIYDFIEALVKVLDQVEDQVEFSALINQALEEEMSAYRLVGSQIATITNEQEIEGVESVLLDTMKVSNVHKHLETALKMWSDRYNPNYRNSIKESISAVEALCKILSGNPKDTLGSALRQLEGKGIKIHPAMEKAWSILYGYTSDKGGIRHASFPEDEEISSAEAKYMLVSCSAFVSYLIQLANDARIKLD